MEKSDYSEVAALWASIKGMGIRSIDDGEEGVSRFIERNPNTSVVALDGDRIIGSVLCGHDGRQACFYHVCVSEDHRLQGIGRAMVDRCVEGLRAEHINRIYLIAFKRNKGGNSFWKQLGWEYRDDRNYYELYLNDENKTTFIV